ncbi:MAG: flippase-like domain-containing protein, partial [Nitrospirae bacterium]
YRITHILTVGFMANNILPARLGDAVRVHMLHRKTDLGHATTTGGLIADKILEGISFLFLTPFLFFLIEVPSWMNYGIIAMLVGIIGIYVLTLVYSRTEIRRWAFLAKLQEGLAPLHNRRVFVAGFCISLVSWVLQLTMIHFTQLAFGVELPFWNALLVLVAVNLAVIVPSAPAHLGTFELACVLSYTFLGVDKNVGLLIGAAYHLVQVLPVTVIGAVMLLVEQVHPWRAAETADPDEACYR